MKLAVLLTILCAAAAAHADPAEDAFRAASQKLADGDVAGAQQAFEATAALDPRGPWADDALAEAAGAAERLGDLEAARRLWRRVVDEFPDSRQSRRARGSGYWALIRSITTVAVSVRNGRSRPSRRP